MSENTSKSLVPSDSEIVKRLAAVEGGKMTVTELLEALAEPAPGTAAKASAPKAVELTESQRKALATFEDVFGGICPDEVRALTPTESTTLMGERLVLDEVAKAIEDRKKVMRETVFNHLDTTADPKVAKKASHDKGGHLILPGEVEVPDHGKRFTREIRSSRSTMTVEALEALVADGVLDRDDFLAATTQTRVVDEAKVTLLLRKKPALASVLAKALTPSQKQSSLYVRNIKR